VIGLGNPLRQDDGVAWQLLQELEDDPGSPRTAHASLRICRQLLPELAAELPLQGRVLFVDAWLQPGGQEPRLEVLTPDPLGAAHLHQLTPAGLLALGHQLFGVAPSASILLVPGRRFGHGTELSAPLRRRLPAARALLRGWLREGAGPCTN
jgi:hydrogenase maturation protease